SGTTRTRSANIAGPAARFRWRTTNNSSKLCASSATTRSRSARSSERTSRGAQAMSRDPIERGLEIKQAHLHGFARSVADHEWLLLILVVLYLLVVDPALAARGAMIASLLAFFVFVVVFRYARPLSKNVRVKLTFEILVMFAFLTAVLEFSG